jgi:Domain of unknown function (DUF4178)
MGFWDWLMGTPDAATAKPGTARKKTVSPSKRTSVFGIEVGDVVTYDTVDYVVKNKISYDDEGFEWFDYLLQDAASGSELWLSAEDDDGITIGVYHEIDLPEGVPPVPRSLTVEGKTFKQYEHSDAQVRVEREDATRSNQSEIEYWEFKGPEGHYMTVTRWGGEHEASVGKEIEEYEIKVYPGNQ